MSNDASYLMISGIQHFVFCKRQWALIHIEQQWAENFFTADGEIMHENVHELSTEKRVNIMITHALPVQSSEYELYGVCDCVEFHRNDKGVTLNGREGKWLPVPVEYKRGKAKENRADELQLMAQAVCLEEMLCCTIERGYLFYGEPHRRTVVVFDKELRDLLYDTVSQMKELYKRGYTPKVKPSKKCSSCSLCDICLPKMLKTDSAKEYVEKRCNAAEDKL